MSSQTSIPSWLPDSVSEWFIEPESESGDTWDHDVLRKLRVTIWSSRIKSVISFAKQEIDKLTNDFRKREDRLRKELQCAEEKIKSDTLAIRFQRERMNNELGSHLSHVNALKRKNVNLRLDIESMKEEIKDLKRKNVNLVLDLESKKEEVNASMDIVNTEQNERERDLKKKILVLVDHLLSGKEKTAKVVSKMKEQKHKNDLVLMELSKLKVSHKKMEKVKDSITRQKEDLEKRNMLLEEEKSNAVQNCEDAKKQHEDEIKTSEHLKNSLRALAQQLNIPSDFFYFEK